MCARWVCAAVSHGTARARRNGVCGGATSFTLAPGAPGLCLLPPDINPRCCPHAGGLCPDCECCVNTACASCERDLPAKPPVIKIRSGRRHRGAPGAAGTRRSFGEIWGRAALMGLLTSPGFCGRAEHGQTTPQHLSGGTLCRAAPQVPAQSSCGNPCPALLRKYSRSRLKHLTVFIKQLAANRLGSAEQVGVYTSD